MNNSKQINIFTDGSSRGNPGPGGWAAVIIDGDQVKELGGGEPDTTNNRMEIKAAIQALKYVHDSREAPLPVSNDEIKIFSDSSYLINGITKWLKNWKRNNWQTIKKEDVLNKDLWIELDRALEAIGSALDVSLSGKGIIWQYVGGHVGIAGNERCDEIATAFADGLNITLYDGKLAGYSIPNILNIDTSEMKAQTKSRRDAKAYSYVSMVSGKIEIHKTWPECERRVKGVKEARYKKALNAEDEEKIKNEFISF